MKRKKVNKRRIAEWGFCYSFLAYPLILFLIFYVYVNLDSFVLAFQDVDMMDTTIRTFAGLENFKEFFEGLKSSGNLISISFKNSIKVYFIGLLISMPLQILFSYMLFKKCFAHRIIKVVIMVPAIVSGFIYSLVFSQFAAGDLQWFMRNNGFEGFPNFISDYPFEITVFFSIWLSFSSSLIVYSNAMRSIDPAVFESAKIDGMSTLFQELRYIILPLIFPTLTTYLVVGFSAIMSDCGALIPFYMDRAPEKAWNMGYFMYKQVFFDATPDKYPLAAAGGMILTLFMAPLTLLLKWFLEKINPVQEA